MATFDVYNLNGEKIGQAELSDAVFGAEIKTHIMWEVVRAQMAAKRAGTHSSKTRSEVSGGGRKPYRQKGTGLARQGSTRAPNHVGGGKVFAPKPRDYSFSVPKKARRVALKSSLSLRAQEKRLILVQDLDIGEIKTRKMAEILKKLGARKALVVEDSSNQNVAMSMRNFQEHKWLPPEGLNVYDVLNHDTLIMKVDVAKALEERLLRPVR